jgi:hypothetical protein
MNEKMVFSYVSLKLMHDYETAKIESSQTNADKDSYLLGYYAVLMSSSFPHFRGAVLLQNEVNILWTQQNNLDSLDLDVAVHYNICKLKTLLPFCTHYTDETLDAFQKLYALIMESLPYTKSKPWKKSSSNRDMKGIISDTIYILIFTHTPTGGKQVTFNKKYG